MPNARSAKSTREKAAALREEAERKAARNRAIIAAVAVLLVIIAAVAGTVAFRSLAKQQSDRKAAAAAPPSNLFTPAGAPYGGLLVGDSSAKVTVEVYSDYMCPICGVFEKKFGPILKQYSAEKKINFVLHPVAILDQASEGSEYSTRATNAMVAVLDTGNKQAALAFHESLYANQPQENTAGLPNTTLLDLAEKAGANRAAITPAVQSVKFRGWVSSSAEKFTKAFPPGGTPTIVLNGKRLDNASLDSLQTQIDAAIKG